MEPMKSKKSGDSAEATKLESPNEICSETTMHEQVPCTNGREIILNSESKNENFSFRYSELAQKDCIYSHNSDKTLRPPPSGAVPETLQSEASEAALEFNTSSCINNKSHDLVSLPENNFEVRTSESVRQAEGSYNQPVCNAEVVFSEWIDEFDEILSWIGDKPSSVLMQHVETIEELLFCFDSMFPPYEESSNEELAGLLQSLSLETGVPVEVLTGYVQPASAKEKSPKCSVKTTSEATGLAEGKREKCLVPDALKEANKCMYEKSQFFSQELKNIKKKSEFRRTARKNISELRNPDHLHTDETTRLRSLVERNMLIVEFKIILKELHQMEDAEERDYCVINNILQASMERLNGEFQKSLQEMETEVFGTLDLQTEQSYILQNCLSAESSPVVDSKPIFLGSRGMDLEERVPVKDLTRVSLEPVLSNKLSKCSEQPENLESAAVIQERRKQDTKCEVLDDANKYQLERLKLLKERLKSFSNLKVLFSKIFCSMLKLQRGHKTREYVTRQFSVYERYVLTLQTKKLTTHFSELLQMEIQTSERIRQISTLMQELWVKIFAPQQTQSNPQRRENIDTVLQNSEWVMQESVVQESVKSSSGSAAQDSEWVMQESVVQESVKSSSGSAAQDSEWVMLDSLSVVQESEWVMLSSELTIEDSGWVMPDSGPLVQESERIRTISGSSDQECAFQSRSSPDRDSNPGRKPPNQDSVGVIPRSVSLDQISDLIMRGDRSSNRNSVGVIPRSRSLCQISDLIVPFSESPLDDL